MGMFDEVHYQGRVWQTKDFECCLAHYHIRDGRLFREINRYTREHGLNVIGEEDTHFHGIIEICDWEPDDKRTVMEGRELERRQLKFTDGVLVEDALVL